MRGFHSPASGIQLPAAQAVQSNATTQAAEQVAQSIAEADVVEELLRQHAQQERSLKIITASIVAIAVVSVIKTYRKEG